MNSFMCQPCNKIFNGITPLKAHLASEKHKKKVKSPFNLEEGASNCVSEPGKFVIDQYITKRPKYEFVNEAEKVGIDQCVEMKSEQECSDKAVKLGIDQYIKEVGSGYKCVACGVFMTGVSTAQSHCYGQKHSKTISHLRRNLDSIDSISTTGNKTATVSNLEKFSRFDQELSLRIMDINDVLEDIKVIGVNDPIKF